MADFFIIHDTMWRVCVCDTTFHYIQNTHENDVPSNVHQHQKLQCVMSNICHVHPWFAFSLNRPIILILLTATRTW